MNPITVNTPTIPSHQGRASASTTNPSLPGLVHAGNSANLEPACPSHSTKTTRCPCFGWFGRLLGIRNQAPHAEENHTAAFYIDPAWRKTNTGRHQSARVRAVQESKQRTTQGSSDESRRVITEPSHGSAASDDKRIVHDEKPTRAEPIHEPEIVIVTVADPDSPDKTLDLKLGTKLGEGLSGEVYLDAEDPEYVIKRFKLTRTHDPNHASDSDPEINKFNTALSEAETFRRYYGEDSATPYIGETCGTHCLRMLRVPGTPINDLPVNSLPPDAIRRYIDLLTRLQDLGIIHGDLKAGNILWDGERFNPIDIQNIRDMYFSANVEVKEYLNYINYKGWKNVTGEIFKKMPEMPEMPD